MGIDKEGAEKAIETKRNRYGKDAFSEWGKRNKGIHRLGYFGWLKLNDPEKLKQIQAKAHAVRRKPID